MERVADMSKENDQLRAVIEEYSGERVIELKIYHDKKCRGCVAMRAVFASDGMEHDFIFMAGVPRTVDELEECEFETWPPREGKQKLEHLVGV